MGCEFIVGLTIIQSSVVPRPGVSEIGASHICPSSKATLVLFCPMTSNNVKILFLVGCGKVGKFEAESVGLNGFGALLRSKGVDPV